MGSFKVLKPGTLTSLQDLGRKGYCFYAIPPSGTMDNNSSRMANLIVGNDLNAPLIECTSIAPTLEFLSDALIAITGSNADWQVNGAIIKIGTKIKIAKGDVLSGYQMQNGFRSYIAIKGLIKTQKDLGSSSLYIQAQLGGHNGQRFTKNDIIEWNKRQSIPSVECEISPIKNTYSFIKIYKGPEYDRLPENDKYNLENHAFSPSFATSRMGSKLDSETKIQCAQKHLEYSVPVFPGVIQATPSGQLIIVLQDGQTTGGYPRIAYLDSDNLNLFNQIPIGKAFKFKVEK